RPRRAVARRRHPRRTRSLPGSRSAPGRTCPAGSRSERRKRAREGLRKPSWNRRDESLLHLEHAGASERLQKPPGVLPVETLVPSLDREKEAIAARKLKALDVEERVIGLRQPAHGEDADDGRDRREEDRELERDHDVGRPGRERTSAEVERIVHRLRPELE